MSAAMPSGARVATDTLTLALQGDRVPLHVFAAATAHFSKLVAELSRDVAPEGLVWEITDLEVGSTTMTTSAVAADGAAGRVAAACLEVAVAVQKGAELGLRKVIVDEAVALAELTHDGVEAVRFESRDEEVLLVKPAVSAMQQGVLRPTHAYGSVTGRAQTLTSRSRLRFTLYDMLSDRAVTCYVEESQEREMADVWDKLVSVEGLVTRDPLTGRPLNVRKISSITAHQPSTAGGYQGALGVLPRRGGEPRAEDRLRRLRDAWSP